MDTAAPIPIHCVGTENTQTAANIKYIENTLNQILYTGYPPPMTSEGLMELFEGHGNKDEIIQWFQEGRITWVKGMSDPIPDHRYQEIMNKSIIEYLNS